MYSLLELHTLTTTSFLSSTYVSHQRYFHPHYPTKHKITQRKISHITNNNAKHRVKLLSLLAVCNLSLKCDNPLPLLQNKYLKMLTYLIIMPLEEFTLSPNLKCKSNSKKVQSINYPIQKLKQKTEIHKLKPNT